MSKDKDKGNGGGSIEKYLKDIQLPAEKNSIINYAKQQGADNALVQRLQKLPNKEYLSEEEILAALENV